MVVDTNPVLIVEVASKQVMDANEAAVTFSGYPREELIRKTLDELYAPETVRLILESCVPRHRLSGTSAVSKIGRGVLRTKTGRCESVELYCQLVHETTPTVLVENRPLNKRM
jgi:PAS domain S-box-containing protein